MFASRTLRRRGKRRVGMIRLTLGPAMVLLAVTNATAQAAQPVADGAIRQWIRELSHDSFSRRQRATRSLAKAGKPVIPAVIDAAKGDDIEVSLRAFAVLKELCLSPDAETSDAACAALGTLTGWESRSVAHRAAEVLQARERHAVACLRNLGASVQVDGKRVTLGERWTGGDEGLAHLKRLTNLESLSLKRASVTNASLKHLKDATNLRSLKLDFVRIGDAGLKHLEGLTDLELLNLRGTAVTDAGLVRLKGMSKLKNLSLEHTLVTDAGMAHLKRFKQLEILYLGGSQVAGPGLRQLEDLARLHYISFQHSTVDDALLNHLAGFTRLKTLGLDDTPVTDVGMEHLTHLTSLEVLWLRNTKVTDASIPHLKNLRSLRRLIIGGTEISDQGRERLNEALPKCLMAR
jgi:hypothetical protein